jgi:hypothetical protein
MMFRRPQHRERQSRALLEHHREQQPRERLRALDQNSNGGFNVASGNSALGSNTTGSDNVASG